MKNAAIAQTVQRQRATVQIEPIHAELEPVQAYARYIAAKKGAPYHVVTIPGGTAAHGMGYRFVSIPDDELAHYLANGATLAAPAAGKDHAHG